jgi:ABC-type sugar transport system permease subunit
MTKTTPGQRTSPDGWLFIAPLLLLIGTFILYPVVMNIYFSFTSWKGFGRETWIGLANYRKMLGDEKFWTSIANTAILLVFIPVSTFATLGVAAMLRDGLRGWSVFRALLYIPNILGVVIIASVFNLFLRDSGPVNQLLVLAGGSGLPWLTQPAYTLFATGFISIVWSPLGFGVIYFLAAMSNIDGSQYEAALIDGSGPLRTFFRITIPGVRFAIEFWVVMSFINVFARMFGFIYVFSQGGPGYGTFTLEYGIYEIGFSKFDPSYSSAWSSVLFVLCGIISIIQIRLMKRSNI